MNASDGDLAETLGPALADPAELPDRDGKLVRLGEVVCFLMDKNGSDSRPLNVAAVLVADKWGSAAERLQVVYRTRRAGFATRIDPGDGVPVQEPRGRTVTTRPVGSWSNWVTDFSAPIPFGGAGGRNPNAWTKPPKPKAADPAPAALCTAPVALFDAMRTQWGGMQLQRAHLFHVRSNLAYLAIPAAVAAELFGYGVEPVTVQAQSAPARLTAPGAEALADESDRLSGLATHDAEKWGRARTDEVNPRPVIRLADLVRLLSDRADLPPKRSVAAMLEKLEGCGECALFVLRPDDLARPVTDAKIWRPRFASGTEQFRAWQQDMNDGFISPGPTLATDEAAWRGISVVDDPDRCIERDAPELPELRGVAGALEMLRVVWVQRALSFASLDAGPAAELAMLRVDAVRLFGIEPVPAKTEPQAATPVPAVHKTAPAATPAAAPEAQVPATWDGRRLFERRTELEAETPKRKAPMAELLRECGLNEREAQRRIAAFKKEKKKERADAASKQALAGVLSGAVTLPSLIHRIS